MTEITHSPILTKNQFVDAYLRGEFGNRAPTWNTIEEYKASNYVGPVHIRNRIRGGQTWYNVNWTDVEMTYREITERGLIKPDDCYFSAMAPTEKTLIQGEVCQRATVHKEQCGLYLLYSMIRKPMREALAMGSNEATSFWASYLLRHHMDPSSWEWLNTLLERYPDHVIEFSTYGINWGTIPKRNTVIWEVRKY